MRDIHLITPTLNKPRRRQCKKKIRCIMFSYINLIEKYREYLKKKSHLSRVQNFCQFLRKSNGIYFLPGGHRVTEVSPYERVAISCGGKKKGEKESGCIPLGVIRIRIGIQCESGRRSRVGGETQRCVAPRGAGSPSSASSVPIAVRHDAARRGACTHDGDAGDRRGTRRINSVVRAKSGAAFRHAVRHVRRTSLKGKRRRREDGEGKERRGNEGQAGRNFTLTPLSPCPMSYKRIYPFTRALS